MTEGNMSVYKYKAFKSGSKVSRLIIFLHGYNSCIEDVEPFAEMLLQHLDNTLVVMPEADTQSERNPLKKQWYALVDVDPDRKRRKPIHNEQTLQIKRKNTFIIINIAPRRKARKRRWFPRS